jgi:hypothetical protein
VTAHETKILLGDGDARGTERIKKRHAADPSGHPAVMRLLLLLAAEHHRTGKLIRCAETGMSNKWQAGHNLIFLFMASEQISTARASVEAVLTSATFDSCGPQNGIRQQREILRLRIC